MEQPSVEAPVEPYAIMPQPEVAELDAADIEGLSHEELITLLPGLSRDLLIVGYQKWVGKDPVPHALSDEELRAGIESPEAELERLGEIDSDKENLTSAYH